LVAGYFGERSALAYNVRISPEYGETGWNSLGAVVGGLAAAFWTFVIALFLIFVIQRIFASGEDPENPTDESPTDI